MWEVLRGKFTPKASRKFGGFFHSDAEHRDFTAIGTAAGLCPYCPALPCAAQPCAALPYPALPYAGLPCPALPRAYG